MKEYLRRAFLYRWNLLVFGGGVAAAVLSPWPDALLPLVAAGEVAYLAMLTSIPKFRQAIDAQVHQQEKQQSATTARSSLDEILGSLAFDAQRRFGAIRARCLEMRTLASQVRGRTGPATGVEDMNTAALDRLLWVFLRLLVSEEALRKFLSRTDADEIRARLEETRARLAASGATPDERIARSLQDSVAAQELRLDNYERARKNAEFVAIELDRIEAKIHALTEASVNRQDPDFLSSQIDSVTESMQTTEKAISELQHITGLVDEMQEPPAILGSAS